MINKSNSNNNHANLPLVIVNLKSAGGATEKRWARTASDLRAHFGAFSVAFTKKAGNGIELAQRAADSGRKLLIACGGDGTINEVANGIMRSGADAELGIIPSGTGGDFRRTLKIPPETRAAARCLRTGETRLIDVGRVTFTDHHNKESIRYFLNVSSFGLSASINEKVKMPGVLQWLPNVALRGKAKYAVSTLQEVLDINFTTVRVKIDEQEPKVLNTVNFCVANSRYFGGGMKIAPEASINDGFFDVINIGDIKTAKILLHAYKLYNGSHLALEEVKSTLAKRIEVAPARVDQTVFIEIDGELPGKLPAIFEILPKALKVRVPAAVNG